MNVTRTSYTTTVALRYVLSKLLETVFYNDLTKVTYFAPEAYILCKC